MGKPIYITDPAVAAAYHVAPGEWAFVEDDAEADWLVDTKQGSDGHYGAALPAAGFVHPDAPQPFAAYVPPEVEPPDPELADPELADPEPARTKVRSKKARRDDDE